jgi:hypothetical protein
MSLVFECRQPAPGEPVWTLVKNARRRDCELIHDPSQNWSESNFAGIASHDQRMLELLIVVVRALILALRGR